MKNIHSVIYKKGPHNLALRKDATGQWVASTMTNKELTKTREQEPDSLGRKKGLTNVLTYSQVGEIQARVYSGETTKKEEAEKYGIDRNTMLRVINVYLNDGESGFRRI